MAAKQTSSQDIENTEDGAVYSVLDKDISKPATDDNVPPGKDMKSDDANTEISEEEWKELCELPAVQSCLDIFEDRTKVENAIKIIKKNQGHFPADIKANNIAVIITELETADDNASPKCSAIAEIFDKGHQGDGIPHELHVTYTCKPCEQEGVKPVIKIQEKEN